MSNRDPSHYLVTVAFVEETANAQVLCAHPFLSHVQSWPKGAGIRWELRIYVFAFAFSHGWH
jgi:hypothetical protein